MRGWLKDLRVKNGLTMKELGAKLGVSESYYCAIEKCSRKNELGLGMAAMISDVFGISVDKIVELESGRIETESA